MKRPFTIRRADAPKILEGTMRLLTTTACLGVLTLVGCDIVEPGPGCNVAVEPGLTRTGVFPSGDVELHFRLDTPGCDGPHPVFVVGHGSGRIDIQFDFQREIAERLLQEGVAVLRYDKRGVGTSGGVYDPFGAQTSDSMVALLASDMVAAVTFVATQRKIDPSRIGLIGQSQAGWIMSAAAASSSDVRFVAVRSGGGITVGIQNEYQRLMQDQSREPEAAEALLANFSGFHGYDPDSSLRATNIPMLFLFGGADRLSPSRTARANLEAIANELAHPFTVKLYPNGNHTLDGQPWWDDMAEWLRANVL